MRFAGRRTFSAPPSAGELNEFAEAMIQHVESLKARRAWDALPITRASAAPASFDSALTVDTASGNTVTVMLPPADSRFAQRELAVVRRSAAGTVNLKAPVGCTVNGVSTLTLTAAIGYFVVLYDGATGFYVQRGP